jgi:Tfp pilus assembly protein PilV
MVRRGASRLAHHKAQAGFSLIELLLTVVFVMLGTQMIQANFLRASDVYGRYTNTLKALLWSSERTARAREALLMEEESEGSGSGVWQTPNKEFKWQQSTQPLAGRNLHSIQVELAWSESGKPFKFQKEIYVYKKDLSQGT